MSGVFVGLSLERAVKRHRGLHLDFPDIKASILSVPDTLPLSESLSPSPSHRSVLWSTAVDDAGYIFHPHSRKVRFITIVHLK